MAEVGQDGNDLDVERFIKENGSDLVELKAMLAKESKKMNEIHSKYTETGGGQKRKNEGARRIGNNSNKINDYRKFIPDDSDDE